MEQRRASEIRHAVVTVSAPARLHLGFLDLSGALGRRFGSLGLAIDGFRTRIGVRPSAEITATGTSAERARRCALRLQEVLGLPHGVEITVHEAIPEHLGLGSGTQMALAVGTAMARIYGLGADTGAIAALTERGARSGTLRERGALMRCALLIALRTGLAPSHYFFTSPADLNGVFRGCLLADCGPPERLAYRL